jgi:2,3-bisphosphoglycerate-independent phosphoglycerate mutase
MGSREIADAIIPLLEKSDSDFVCLNFAAPDMVGHTGVREAAVQACRIVDESLHQVIDAALVGGYTSIVLADHGNVDQMVQEDGSPHTAHTLAKVPCILVQPS